MPPAVIGTVGLAASVGGQVAQMSAQSRAAKKQDQAIEEQVQSAQQRLRLSYDQQKIVREQAKIAQLKEQEQLKATHQTNLLAIQEQELQSKLTELQSQAESGGIRNDAKAQVASLLKDYSNQQTQLLTANENDLEGLNQATDGMTSQDSAGKVAKAGKQGSPDTVSAASDEVALANEQGEMSQGVQRNVATRDFQARNAQQYGQALSDNLIKQAEAAAGYIESTQANQTEADNLAANSGRRVEGLQNKRNLKASKAAYLSAQGSNSTQYLSQLLGERSNMSQANAQKGQIQRPGFLSYASLGIGAATQAYQSGLLSFGRSAPSTMINTMPPPTSSMINTMPPTRSTYSGTTGNEGRA